MRSKTQIPENIEDFLDEQNKALLAKVRDEYTVAFEIHDKPYSGIYTINNSATIYLNSKDITNATIAHELLHLWFKTLGGFTSNHIYLACVNLPKQSKIFSKELCDHIGNCMEHHKFYPKFLEMGYNPKDFIQNAQKEQSKLSTLKRLVLGINPRYIGQNVDAYIGNLISIYAHQIPVDYTKHLSILKSKDADLFELVTDFWDRWDKFDANNIDPIFNSDFDIYEKFIWDIGEWVSDRIIL